MPKLSVVMSVKNGEHFLRPSIASILSQTFGDFEFIIVNDGSTDSSASILEEYKKADPRIRIIHQDNKGLTKSLNIAIQEARAPLIVRQDADDISLKKRFAMQVKKFDSDPSLVLLGARIATIYDTSNSKQMYQIRHPVTDRAIRQMLKVSNPISHSTAMFRRSAFVAAGGYNESFQYSQDIELWHRLGNFGTMENLPEVLVLYRAHAKSISSAAYDFQFALASLACTFHRSGPGPNEMLSVTRRLHNEQDIFQIINELHLDRRYYSFCKAICYFRKGFFKKARMLSKQGIPFYSAPAYKLHLLLLTSPFPDKSITMLKNGYYQASVAISKLRKACGTLRRSLSSIPGRNKQYRTGKLQ